jgi:hypothetical protein
MITHTDLIKRLREWALPDPHDEREVIGAPLLRRAADALESLEQQVAALTEELQKRDKCSYMGPMRDCPTHGIGPELAAAQAREAKLREAMLSDSALAGRFHKLLALPADDSALKAALKAERERICGLYSPDDTASDFMDKIRGLA